VSAPAGAPIAAAAGAWAVARLEAAGIDSARLDAEVLLSHALRTDRAALIAHSDRRLSVDEARQFERLVVRRAAREPVAYIVGHKGFRYLDLAVDQRVLIPRPDTETLVEAATERAPHGARVHDVGTGSGAVALALADERRDLRVSASDASPGAVAVARMNADALGVRVPIALADGLPPGDYDLVVANLPYVRDDEWDGLAPEIREYEPRMALTSGADGLDAIRALIGAAPAGMPLLLEHAPDQGEAVRALLRPGAEAVRDLGGRDRVTVGKAP
jgi:release factor glutamine methyltransferase